MSNITYKSKREKRLHVRQQKILFHHYHTLHNITDNAKPIWDNYIYPHFLYIHLMMNDIPHSLKNPSSKQKEYFRHPMADMFFVKHAIHVTISNCLLYSWKGFHKCPHGTAKIGNARKYENAIKCNGNNFYGGSVTNIFPEDIKYIKEEYVRVAYPGSTEVLQFNNLNIKQSVWLEFVLQEGLIMNKRDACSHNGISARIRFGYTQKQSYSPLFKYRGEIFKMPYTSFPSFRNRRGKITLLPTILCKQFSEILSVGQLQMENLYFDKEVMNNKKRSAIFGIPFGKSFDEGCKSKFEYAEIFVETEALVIRHLDYQNDFRKNYDYGTSYSFIRKRYTDGKFYRVNFLMCTRKLCGDFMDELSSEFI